MADPTTYRPAPGTIPTQPGVYKFRDADGRVIYVGKAKNLRQRLSNYFQDLTQLHPRTRQMVTTACSVEWTVVGSEVEALQLEYTWIKKFDPRFNVKYRDDKTYPMLAVSVAEQYPRAFVYRGPRKKGVRYFGPYSHAWAIRETLDLLIRVFPLRTCSTGVFRRHKVLERPCLLGYIDKCSAPCVGRVSAAEHRQIVNDFVSFMNGRTGPVVAQLKREMHSASEDLDFERAARLRDNIAAIDKAMEKQSVVFGDGTDADVIAVVPDQLSASVQLFHVRDGRIRGQRGWVVDHEYGEDVPAILQSFLVRFYGEACEQWEQENSADDAALGAEPSAGVSAADITAVEKEDIKRRGVDQQSHDNVRSVHPIPREILVSELPADMEQTTAFLQGLRGTNVSIRVPQRGDKKALLETVFSNATEALKQHKLKRTGDLTARSAAIKELQEYLFMDQAPLRIECTDISHIQGTDVVASLVVFEDGLPKKSDYRRYKIKEAAGDGHSNDVASIAEVTERRFIRHNRDKRSVPDEMELAGATFAEEAAASAGAPERAPRSAAGGEHEVEEMLTDAARQRDKRFAYPPQLFIVDGGLPQVNAAQEVFDSLGITDVTLIGLAKRLEEVWVPGEAEPIILPRQSQALYLLQHIRDEAHRFAITFHRQQRSQRMRSSVLDGIKGVGPDRRAELVKHFGSVAALKKASVEEIAQVKGFGPKLAQTVYEGLRH